MTSAEGAAGIPLVGATNTVRAGDFSGTWRDLPDRELPAAAAVFVENNLEAVTALWSSVRSGGELLITSRTRFTDDLAADLLSAGLAVVVGDQVTLPETPRPAEPGRIWLLTSGSTGRPKRVAHTLASLTTVGVGQPPRTWLCPYTHGAYAWWQVVTLGLSLPEQDIVFIEASELDQWPAVALAGGVTAASGTPTFWRQALYADPDSVAALPLEQVTLGGEPVDQAILTRMRETFPDARVSWIYASSEAGATIAVHDGLAGFPVEWLDRDAPGRARLSIDGDELLIASPKRGAGIDAVLRTGDRVEITDGRVRITGRLSSDEINVGGAKVSASSVRDVLQSHPAVTWAAVRGRKAPIVGALVAADVVTDAPIDQSDLLAWCRDRLPDYAVPRRIKFLEEIPLKESLKSDV